MMAKYVLILMQLYFLMFENFELVYKGDKKAIFAKITYHICKFCFLNNWEQLTFFHYENDFFPFFVARLEVVKMKTSF